MRCFPSYCCSPSYISIIKKAFFSAIFTHSEILTNIFHCPYFSFFVIFFFISFLFWLLSFYFLFRKICLLANRIPSFRSTNQCSRNIRCTQHTNATASTMSWCSSLITCLALQSSDIAILCGPVDDHDGFLYLTEHNYSWVAMTSAPTLQFAEAALLKR